MTAITGLKHFKQLIPTEYPFILTWVECGKCILMSCRRQETEIQSLDLVVCSLIDWTTTPLHPFAAYNFCEIEKIKCFSVCDSFILQHDLAHSWNS